MNKEETRDQITRIAINLYVDGLEAHMPPERRRHLGSITDPIAHACDELVQLLQAPEPRIIEIPTHGVCDYCSKDMKYAGSSDGVTVTRSCEEHLQIANKELKG